MMSAAYPRDGLAGAGAAGAHDAEPFQTSRPCAGEGRSRIRVLIAHRQSILRYGLRALLANEPDIAVVAEADTGLEAVEMARRLHPDVVMIDLQMPRIDGITATRTIRAELPDTQVVMTGVNEDAPVIQSIRAGACAYVPMDARIEVVLRAIRGARAGQVALPAHAAAELVRVIGRPDALSARESAVLRLVAHGMANKQIARELGITASTVKSHVYSIFGKLGLLSRTQAALYAARTGLVAFEQPTTGSAAG
jgi:two-component system, NarL family, response regulator LiaR